MNPRGRQRYERLVARRWVRGNRAALLRAGVLRSSADEVAGGELYRNYLPVPAAARLRDMVVKVHSPSTFGLDYFMMGKKKSPKDYEGFLLLLQPLSCYISTAKIKSRSSLVSACPFLQMRRASFNRARVVSLSLTDLGAPRRNPRRDSER
jgi:hypothetical protein